MTNFTQLTKMFIEKKLSQPATDHLLYHSRQVGLSRNSEIILRSWECKTTNRPTTNSRSMEHGYFQTMALNNEMDARLPSPFCWEIENPLDFLGLGDNMSSFTCEWQWFRNPEYVLALNWRSLHTAWGTLTVVSGILPSYSDLRGLLGLKLS